MSDQKRKLRSQAWFGTADKNGFMYRSWMKNQGFPAHQFDGKPVIGICNTCLAARCATLSTHSDTDSVAPPPTL